jgi:hypothetical protein
VLKCAVLNDRVASKNGWAVLRESRVPAVLSEASFHSNPEEERRLRDPVYNRREAYGLFLGLARWAQAGLPRARVLQVTPERGKTAATALLALDDGVSSRGGWGAELSTINPASVMIRLNGRELRGSVDEKSRVKVSLPTGFSGRGALYVDFETALGQHVLHPWVELRAAE